MRVHEDITGFPYLNILAGNIVRLSLTHLLTRFYRETQNSVSSQGVQQRIADFPNTE